MKSQRSILSFFQKPQPRGGHRDAAFPARNGSPPAHASSPGPIGADTAPEEGVPRRFLPGSFAPPGDGSGSSSLYLAIKRELVEVDPKETPRDHGFSGPREVFEEGSVSGPHENDNERGSGRSVKLEDGVHNPETPPVRPVVPRLKRVQLECGMCRFHDKMSFLPESDKRARLFQEPDALIKTRNENAESTSNLFFWWESTSKFDWLDPERIQDANRRRPDDPLYDKKTLYIPPDALEEMSASQKQYWGVKSQNMDVVLFFKVGKFYELYELDAEIRLKELDWKPTSSGIGKCRQVGISESVIDDAVEKLVARGYKVGRIEQVQTFDHDKAKGASSDQNKENVEARFYIRSTMASTQTSCRKEDTKRENTLRSSAWNGFVRYKDEADRWKAKCKYCGAIFAADPSKNGTSSMLRHLQIRCKRKPPKDPT